jgi:hypothetical protein
MIGFGTASEYMPKETSRKPEVCASSATRNAWSSNDKKMTGKCAIGRNKGLEADTDERDGSPPIPGGICDRKATDTIVLKSLDMDNKGKLVFHVCKDHWLDLKRHNEYNFDPNNKEAYRSTCCKKHAQQALRFIFRKGIR